MFLFYRSRAEKQRFRRAYHELSEPNYSTEYADILKLAREDKALAETLNVDGEILAEVVYAIRQEMARTLSDIVMRRTGIGTLGQSRRGCVAQSGCYCRHGIALGQK